MERESNPMQPMCRSGCGFYGNPATDGLCSVCYKDSLRKKQQPPVSSPPVSVPSPQPSSTFTPAIATTDTAQPTVQSLQQQHNETKESSFATNETIYQHMAASNKKNGDNTSKCNNGKKFNEVVDAKDPTKQQQQQNKLNSIFGAEVFGSGAPSDINTPANAAVTGTANDKFADADTGRDFARPEASLLPATNQTSGAEKAVKVDEDQKDGKVLVTNRKVKFAICPRVINGTKSSALPKPVSAHASINNTSNKNLVTNLGGKTKFKAKHSIAPMQSRPVATFTKTGSAVRTSPITETCNTTIERQEQALPSTKSLTLTSIAARTVAHKGNFRVHSLIPIRCKSTLGKVAPAVASYSLLAVPMVDNPDKSDPSGNDDNQKNDLGNRRSNDAAENNRESGNRARNNPNGASSTNSNNNSNIPNGNSNTGNANVRNRNAENCVGQDCTKTEYGNSVSNSSRKRKINEENTAKTNDTAAAAGPSTSTKAAEEDDKDKEEDKDAKKKKNRCAECRKKVGLTGFQCRCGGLFCAVHRYSDKHDCTFNYREHGAQEIRRNNPVVVGEKIQKI